MTKCELGEIVESYENVNENPEAKEKCKKILKALAGGVAVVGAGAIGFVEGGPVLAAVSAAVGSVTDSIEEAMVSRLSVGVDAISFGSDLYAQPLSIVHIRIAIRIFVVIFIRFTLSIDEIGWNKYKSGLMHYTLYLKFNRLNPSCQ